MILTRLPNPGTIILFKVYQNKKYIEHIYFIIFLLYIDALLADIQQYVEPAIEVLCDDTACFGTYIYSGQRTERLLLFNEVIENCN